ncbi:hypothetical protein G6L99_19235 [Agrobacterium rhizogenes]|uniref:hypothetical protein n=1 Tax=Rhizobium rhizogenes TaxID=359 RepID=UPI0015730089|nr:hypothetical protein [Rhizobium rhizogenes]NTH14251.1 hypothetical protein [Rhizobium rhizogenes]
MNGLTTLPRLEPANPNAVSHASFEAETKAALERERDELLYVTNYMEALYARLLVASHTRKRIDAR